MCTNTGSVGELVQVWKVDIGVRVFPFLSTLVVAMSVMLAGACSAVDPASGPDVSSTQEIPALTELAAPDTALSPDAPSSIQEAPGPTSLVERDQLQDMSLEEKVGQLLMLGFSGTDIKPDLAELLRETQPGGLLLSPLNVASPQSLAALTTEAQEIARRELRAPLLISANQEGGSVLTLRPPFTQFPSAQEVGLACDRQLTRRIGLAIGSEMQAVGINMDLAPVLDVGHLNLAIGDRAFGENHTLVSELGVEFITGLADAGVIATAKHFPGHGSAEGDSHIVLPADSRSAQTIRTTDLAPYRRAIESGLLDVIMTAHVHYSALDGILRPATLSPRILIAILRQELGFEGVIISDSMTMGAMTNPNRPISIGAVEAVLAGVDIILIPAYPTYQQEARTALLAAVQDGRITADRLDESVRRILELKRKYQIGKEISDRPILATDEHNSLVAEVRANAGTASDCHL